MRGIPDELFRRVTSPDLSPDERREVLLELMAASYDRGWDDCDAEYRRLLPGMYWEVKPIKPATVQ